MRDRAAGPRSWGAAGWAGRSLARSLAPSVRPQAGPGGRRCPGRPRSPFTGRAFPHALSPGSPLIAPRLPSPCLVNLETLPRPRFGFSLTALETPQTHLTPPSPPFFVSGSEGTLRQSQISACPPPTPRNFAFKTFSFEAGGKFPLLQVHFFLFLIKCSQLELNPPNLL